jgi:3-hydroxyacyl-CoA dehydrogenase
MLKDPSIEQIQGLMDGADRPVIAAIHGTALGGGLETALVCHYRVAVPSAKVGLPEVNIGLLPGAGGTQRLPRFTGAPFALELIVSGAPVSTAEALRAGCIDRLVAAGDDLVAAALAYAHELLAAGTPPRSCFAMKVDTNALPPTLFADARARLQRSKRGFHAPQRCVDAVEAACSLPLAEGLQKERALFMECFGTPQAHALQHLFFAERAAGKVPGVDRGVAPRRIERVAVIGAGTMGGGIAMSFANAGIPVRLLEAQPAALAAGLDRIRENYAISVQRGKLTAAAVEQRMALLQGTLDYQALGDADLVIEAAFENMAIKQDIFRKLDAVCKPGAVLATNTSTLDVDAIAAVTARPQDVIGLHFFSPANVMRLLEIVRGERTGADVVVTAIALARTIGKVPVVVGVCFGFVGNRMLAPYAREAGRLLLEGATPAQVDRALTGFGYAMGPLSMGDLVGLDVSHRARQGLPMDVSRDPSFHALRERLVPLGRYGQKAGRGFYRYEGRTQHDDPEVLALAEQVAGELGIPRRRIEDQEIVERCVYALINEGARILEEGIAYRSGDCDVIYANGYGFPLWRGGPLQYADEIGLDQVLAAIKRYREQLGDYGEFWFQPAPLLERLAAAGQSFSSFGTAPAR